MRPLTLGERLSRRARRHGLHLDAAAAWHLARDLLDAAADHTLQSYALDDEMVDHLECLAEILDGLDWDDEGVGF